ncbi:SMP-30/gluconolactonase/LRE family protein [Asticcacaulis sp. AC402]|uniref:SMP-30/gluconolactonase/LRE family protein n=1 Tax=Asticcacaulis sp. AC402 TaxID=1282361 RepID=UPI0003C3C5D8|nr:SMP-30/gluconolactonase/LRE family protein [Asticcacaulis sp. AC402]ESQ76590.1 gluconolaconase [Asticcacaulis sp. AC402]
MPQDIIRRTEPGALLGEGPLWSRRDQCVYWVDILSHKLNAWYLDGRQQTWSFDCPVCWVIEREKGGFIAGLMTGFAELSLDPFVVRHIVNPYPHEPENRLNDAKADDRGRIWAGSMHKPITRTSGGWHRLNTDKSVTHVDGPYTIPNGPAFSADHRQVFHTDTDLRQVFLFDIDAEGELAGKRPWLTFPEDWGYPDGMTMDAQGGLWIAHWGAARITRFKMDATPDFHIDLPAKQITSMAFAGNDLNRLFVTSAAIDLPDDREAGTLFEIPSESLRGHTGLEPQKFKG